MMPIFYRRDLVGEPYDGKSNGAKSDDDFWIQIMLTQIYSNDDHTPLEKLYDYLAAITDSEPHLAAWFIDIFLIFDIFWYFDIFLIFDFSLILWWR